MSSRRLQRLSQYRSYFSQPIDIKNLIQPAEGWIRSLRKAIGMSGPQLAARLKLSKSQVSQMERMETEHRITLKQLRRVADSLECDLVYALVPRQSLDQILRHQAYLKTSGGEYGDKGDLEREQAVERLLLGLPTHLWDSHNAEDQSEGNSDASSEAWIIGENILLQKNNLEKLARDFFIQRLILFGAAARGEDVGDESIELIVEFLPGLKAMVDSGQMQSLSRALSRLLQGSVVELHTRGILADPKRRRQIEAEMVELYAS